MIDKYYILKNKKPVEVDLITWAHWFENSKDRIIVQEALPSGKWISTVFLGTDHNFGEGEPLFFETMVFTKKGGEEVDVERYSIYEEAEKGHQLLKEKYL